MQHIDLKERIIIWVAFDFPDLPYPEFGLLDILRNGRTGFRCSGAPPIRAGRPGAPSRLSDRSLGPQLCTACRSLPAGEILPLAHTNGSSLRLVKHLRWWWGLSHKNAASEMFFLLLLVPIAATFICLNCCKAYAFISVLRLWLVCVV